MLLPSSLSSLSWNGTRVGSTAAVERAHSDRARSGSKKDGLAALRPSLRLFISMLHAFLTSRFHERERMTKRPFATMQGEDRGEMRQRGWRRGRTSRSGYRTEGMAFMLPGMMIPAREPGHHGKDIHREQRAG